MTTYQLLRSNKESGPYTIDDLRKLGLKPFDLIWVEGMSFSWRYPSEINELKEFAPTAEVSASPVVNAVAETAETAIQPAPVETISTTHVYAIKPKENETRIQTIQVPAQDPPAKDPAPGIIVEEEQLPIGGFKDENIKSDDIPNGLSKEEKKSEVKELYIVHSQRKIDEPRQDDPGKTKEQPAEPRRTEPQPDKKFSDRFRAVEEKRLEVKEMFPVKPKRKRDLTDTLMLGFVAVALLVTGYLIGAFYSGKKEKAATETVAAPVQPVEEAAETPADNSASPDPSQLNSAPASVKPKPVVKQPKKDKKAEETVAAAAEQQAKKDNAAAEEQKQKEANEKELAKTAARATIYQDVRVKANDFKKVFLGGISDLKITVNNGSKYVLDEVVIEVSYLKNNKEVFKTESLHFQNLLPGAEATVAAPDSKRGNKIDYRVLSVKSKDLGM